MRKFIAGAIFGIMLSSVVVFGAGQITSAEYNTTAIEVDGMLLTLDQPLISVKEEGVSGVFNYMPVRAVLEALGYTVDWDGNNNKVVLTSPATPDVEQPQVQPPVNEETPATTEPLEQQNNEAGEGLVLSKVYKSLGAIAVEENNKNFTVKSGTAITMNGVSVTIKELEPGMQVEIEANDSNIVTSIKVVRSIPDTQTGEKSTETIGEIYKGLGSVSFLSSNKNYTLADYAEVIINGETKGFKDLEPGMSGQVIINKNGVVVYFNVTD